jgi:hypothetical protein
MTGASEIQNSNSPNHDGVTELDARTLHSRQSNREGLAQRALLVRDVVGELVQPGSGVGMEAR